MGEDGRHPLSEGRSLAWHPQRQLTWTLLGLVPNSHWDIWSSCDSLAQTEDEGWGFGGMDRTLGTRGRWKLKSSQVWGSGNTTWVARALARLQRKSLRIPDHNKMIPSRKGENEGLRKSWNMVGKGRWGLGQEEGRRGHSNGRRWGVRTQVERQKMPKPGKKNP